MKHKKTFFPPAVESLTFMENGDAFAHVCAWHPKKEKESAEHWAKKNGFTVSHGICIDCAELLRPVLIGSTILGMALASRNP